MQLADRMDLEKLAKLKPAVLWVHINALVHCAKQLRPKDWISRHDAEAIAVPMIHDSGDGEQLYPVRELIAAGLWRRQGAGFQILPSYGGTKRTAAEIEDERDKIRASIPAGMPAGEIERYVIHHLAHFIAGTISDATL
jgi:hypothetical protein